MLHKVWKMELLDLHSRDMAKCYHTFCVQLPPRLLNAMLCVQLCQFCNN